MATRSSKSAKKKSAKASKAVRKAKSTTKKNVSKNTPKSSKKASGKQTSSPPKGKKSKPSPAMEDLPLLAQSQAEGSESVEPVEEPAPPADESATEKSPKRRGKTRYATAESMAKSQRSISVSEFFAKNRHLLGFDNPRKALLTTVKEAVDNSLDACEEAGILPVVEVWIRQIDETHFCVTVQDNGPGIVRNQIPNIFGKLLYGSKFHRLRMSRGQQGIGISAAGMYGLLTTGKPIVITSRTSKRSQAHHYELQIDTKKNKPDIIVDQAVDSDFEHGTVVEIQLDARYQKGRQSVDDYLQQTAIANPHVTLIYHAPDGRTEEYKGAIQTLPALPKEVKPHPHGVELGILIKMIQDSGARTAQQFFTSEFSRVTPRVATDILEKVGLNAKSHPNRMLGEKTKELYRAIQETKILAPATNCVVPIGEEQLIAGLRSVVEADFYTAVSRRPAVYRGNPFIIEAAIAYGKPETKEEKVERIESEIEGDDSDDNADTSQAKVIRFANRVPLQYQQGACAITKSVLGMSWRKYGLQQSRGALPSGDLTIVVHMASVWVPFTSESKEAVASYPEILKELRLALQDCGRRLGAHIRKTHRIRQELKKRSYIEKYIPAIGEALRDILDLKDKQVVTLCESLKGVLERSRKM
ncbi:MAG: DNA topoisomerase VI subunit B [Phycisphaerae bacterium]|nr:DNA topoisomerase VI subunit B [Phycisphaerae bacterium]